MRTLTSSLEPPTSNSTRSVSVYSSRLLSATRYTRTDHFATASSSVATSAPGPFPAELSPAKSETANSADTNTQSIPLDSLE